MNNTGDGEESTPPQVAIQPMRVGLLLGLHTPPRACLFTGSGPSANQSYFGTWAFTSLLDGVSKIDTVLEFLMANRQNRWMALGVNEQKIETTDDRHSGFINIFGEILVENSHIKQGLGNNIYTSTEQDSMLILPQKI